MFSHNRSVQARRQKRDDRGQFKPASPTSPDSPGGGGGDSNDNGGARARGVVKKCGHRYCISTSSDSGDNPVWQQGTGASSSEGSVGGEPKIRGQRQSTPPRMQSRRALPSSVSSDGRVRMKGSQWRSAPTRREHRRACSSSAGTKETVGVELIDLTSTIDDYTPDKQNMPSSSLRAPASNANYKHQPLDKKGKKKATHQGPLDSAWTLHHQLMESDSMINMLVGQLKNEKAKNKALQRAVLEASKNASK